MEFVTLEVKFKHTPKIMKFCKKCGKEMAHQSSNRFRVNANGKNLDVWLIYKCTSCDSTFKRELYSRVSCACLGKKTLQGFQENDAVLAEKYAFDVDSLKGSGITYIPPEYSVECQSSLVGLSGSFQVEILSEYPLQIRLTAVLKKAFGLSASQVKRLLDSSAISIVDERAPKKACLLQKQTVIYSNDLKTDCFQVQAEA